MRYTKQREKYSCAPVAILNALRWAGDKVSYEEHFLGLSMLCNCQPPDGTTHKAFDRAARAAGRGVFRVQLVRKPTLAQIERHLASGGALVLNYRWRKKKKKAQRHFILVTGMSDSRRTYYVVNDFRKGPALRKYQKRFFKRWNLRFQSTDRNYKAWFLSKVE